MTDTAGNQLSIAFDTLKKIAPRLMINYMKLEITEQKPWRQLGAFARII
ncbi:MAG TPA: hypothetical protein PKY85_08730 [Nitrosomonas sp.]|nr:hypothetical protein [Nitrosomonas sp.]